MTSDSNCDVVIINPDCEWAVADLGLAINPGVEEATMKVEFVIVDAEKQTTRVVMGAGPWSDDPVVVDPAV
jgi:hypothetical protein